MTKEEPEISQAQKDVEARLKLLKNHNFELLDGKNSEIVFLRSPWGDESLALIGYKDGEISKDLFEALEKVILPKEFSAIYHVSKKKLEIIWTAYKLQEPDEVIGKRKFEFKIGSKKHKCHFSKSSDELIEIAKHAAFVKLGDSRFRNLQSFKTYINKEAHKDDRIGPRLGEPLSFFIENLQNDSAEWMRVSRHLNFYLRYYDDRSPHIIIHDTEEKTKYPKTRYVEGSFPSKISTRELNPILLSFWIAAYDEEITTQFLLYYRILEYVSGSYLQAQQRQDLLKILSSPTAQDALDQTLDRVTAVVRQDKLNEFDRFERMFVDLIDKKKIWSEACQNSDFFLEQVCFDGGLTVEPLITDNKSINAFDTNRMKALAASLRKIRNALAHGGEQQSGSLILPTSRNLDLLIPWTHIASTAAAEALLYEHLG